MSSIYPGISREQDSGITFYDNNTINSIQYIQLKNGMVKFHIKYQNINYRKRSINIPMVY